MDRQRYRVMTSRSNADIMFAVCARNSVPCELVPFTEVDTGTLFFILASGHELYVVQKEYSQAVDERQAKGSVFSNA